VKVTSRSHSELEKGKMDKGYELQIEIHNLFVKQ